MYGSGYSEEQWEIGGYCKHCGATLWVKGEQSYWSWTSGGCGGGCWHELADE